MRRGQSRDDRNSPDQGFTKQQLLEVCEISAKTFDNIRKAARISGPTHGGLNWVFSVDDVIALVRRAESGSFSERGGPPAAAWRALLAENGIQFE